MNPDNTLIYHDSSAGLVVPLSTVFLVVNFYHYESEWVEAVFTTREAADAYCAAWQRWIDSEPVIPSGHAPSEEWDRHTEEGKDWYARGEALGFRNGDGCSVREVPLLRVFPPPAAEACHPPA